MPLIAVRRREVTIRSQAAAARCAGRRPARLVALSVAAEQRRVFGGDRQPEPAAPAVARRIGLVEAFEDPRRAGRAARPVRGRPPTSEIASLSAASVTSTGEPAACSRALSRRLPRIRSSRRGSVSTTSGSAGRSSVASGRRAAVTGRDQSAEVDRLERDLLGPRIEPRDLHQVVDERPQPADVGDEQLAGPPALRRQRVEMLAQDRRLGDQRRQRCPQLVRDIGDEAPVLGLGRLEPADRLGQRLGHPVEALRPRPELVVRGDRHARRQVAALDPLGGPAGGLDRGEDAAGDRPARRAARRGRGSSVPTMSASRSWPSASSMRR